MYGLSSEDLAIQTRARDFADELIPFEEQAERNDGELPADVTAAHAKRARELGLHSTNMPAELGGGGCTSVQQVLVQEQMGRVTNALGWVAATPPSWLPAVATSDQIERYVRPAISGEREECYAITEEGAGSDVDAIESTAHRDGDAYVLNGVKWHPGTHLKVESHNYDGNAILKVERKRITLGSPVAERIWVAQELEQNLH